MKRERLAVVVGLAAVLMVAAGLVWAQGPGGPRGPFDPNKMTGGVIKKIDAKAMTFEVERRMNRESQETTTDTIYCTDKTTFKKDGADAKFADFKEGDRIRATGNRKDGKFWADEVSSMRPMRPPSQ